MLVPLSGRAKTRPTEVAADRALAERANEFSHTLGGSADGWATIDPTTAGSARPKTSLQTFARATM